MVWPQGEFSPNDRVLGLRRAGHRQPDLLLVQDMAVPDGPHVRRAQVGAVSAPLVPVHQGSALVAQPHFFLLQLREPNQKPMIPPSIAISSSLKITSVTLIRLSMSVTRPGWVNANQVMAALIATSSMTKM